MEDWNLVSLDNIGNGAAVELFNNELSRCYSNIMDPNTDRYKAREVKLVVRMQLDKKDPDGKRINYDLKVVSKLESHIGHGGSIYSGMEKGELVAYEQKGVQLNLPDTDGNVVNFRRDGSL